MARKPSKQTSKRKKRPVKRILTTQVLAAGGDAFLDPETGVRLLSWNLAKRPGSKLELADHMPTADLVCVQEAKPSLLPELPGSSHFASSFRGLGPDAEFHGVATLARAQSRDRGHPTAIGSRWREGWVVTPKMALATDYDLGDQKLLVVNVHAYNFQPVFKYMLRDQFERIAERVAAHGGPAVVCGDFNTWRKDRLRLVEVLLHDFEAGRSLRTRCIGKRGIGRRGWLWGAGRCRWIMCMCAGWDGKRRGFCLRSIRTMGRFR